MAPSAHPSDPPTNAPTAARRSLLSATVLVVILAACSSSSPAAPTTALTTAHTAETTKGTQPPVIPGDELTPEPAVTPGLPTTVVDATGATVTIESAERIVPVDGDLAEIVYALGFGDHVVATDLSATYPPEVDDVPDIGYQRALNPEPIAAVEPTLVLATDLAQPAETLDRLRDLAIPVVVIDRLPTLEGPAHKIRRVAEALGVPERGEKLAGTVTTEIAAAVATATAMAADTAAVPRVAALYLRGERVQLVLGKGSGIDVIFDAIGVVDVADELGIVDNRQITAEALLAAAPDVLVVTTSGLESVGGVEGLLQIPGIAQTPAGEHGNIAAYEDQYLLGGGPRTGRLMTELVADLFAFASNPTESGDPNQ